MDGSSGATAGVVGKSRVDDRERTRIVDSAAREIPFCQVADNETVSDRYAVLVVCDAHDSATTTFGDVVRNDATVDCCAAPTVDVDSTPTTVDWKRRM